MGVLINGARLFKSEHYTAKAGGCAFTNVSGRHWGGVVCSSKGKVEVATDLKDHMLVYHIGHEEAVALRNILLGFANTALESLEGKMFAIHIHNKGLLDILEKGGSTNNSIHKIFFINR